jgi:hypothetical protein
MKKIFTIAMVAISVLSYSQDMRNKISVNPIQLIGYNILNSEYERGFNEGKTGVAFFIGRTGNATREYNDVVAYVSEQSVTYKLYSKTISESSFWFGPQLSVATGDLFNSRTDSYAFDIGTLGISGKVGYQVIIKSFYLDPYVSVGYAITNDLFGNARYQGSFEESKVLLNYGLKMGIIF